MSIETHLKNGITNETFVFEDDEGFELEYRGNSLNGALDVCLGTDGEEYRKVVLKFNLRSLSKGSKVNRVILSILPDTTYYDPIVLTKEDGFDGGTIENIENFIFTTAGRAYVDLSKYLLGKENEDVYFGIISDGNYQISVDARNGIALHLDYLDYASSLKYRKMVEGTVGNKIGYGVDIRNGALVVKQSLYHLEGCLMPMNLDLVYGSCNSDKVIEEGMPLGWKLSYFCKINVTDNAATYLDMEGVTHNFYVTNTAGKYYDRCGSGLILTSLSDGTYQIHSGTNEYLFFNSNGYLTTIRKYFGLNYIDTLLEYDSNNRLVKITDPMGNIVTLVYIGTVSIGISCTNNHTRTLTISDNTLVNVGEQSGRVTTITYSGSSSDALIASIKSDNGEKVSFTYNSNKSIGEILDVIEKENVASILEKRNLKYNLTSTEVKNYHNACEVYEYDAEGQVYRITDGLDQFENLKAIKKENYASYIFKLESPNRYILEQTNFVVDSFEYEFSDSSSSDGNSNQYEEPSYPIPEQKILSESVDNLNFESNEEYLVTFSYVINGAYRTKTAHRRTYLEVYQNGIPVGHVDLAFDKTEPSTAEFVFKTISANKPVFKLIHVENIGEIITSKIHVVKYNKNERKTCFNVEVDETEAVNFEGVNYYPKTTPFDKLEYLNEENEVVEVEVDFFEEDIRENIKNYVLAEEGRFDIWHNHKRGLIANVKNVKIFSQDVGVNLSDLKMCIVTETNDKKVFSYDDYSSSSSSTKVLRIERQKLLYKDVFYESYRIINRDYFTTEILNFNGMKVNYQYNLFGNLICEKTSSINSNLCVTKNYTYTLNGKRLTKVSQMSNDCQTATTSYTYNNYGLISKVTLPNGLEYNYTYDNITLDLIKISYSDTSGTTENNIVYLKDLISNMSHKDNIGYDFTYDKYNMINSVRYNYNGTTNNFINMSSEITTLLDEHAQQYPSGYKEKVIVDEYGNVIKKQYSIDGMSFLTSKEYYYSGIKLNNIEDISNPNDEALGKTAYSRLVKVVDNVTNDITYINYDLDDNISEVAHTAISCVSNASYEYDDSKRLKNVCEIYQDDTITTTYQYLGNDSKPTDEIEKVDINYKGPTKECSYILENTFDDLKRITNVSTSISSNKINQIFTYPVSENETGTLPNLVTYNISNPESAPSSMTIGSISYTYDNMNNIASIADTFIGNNVETFNTSYQYDKFGRLIRENNQKLAKTVKYTYDDKGNITKKEEGSYSTADFFLLTSTKTYGYSTTYPDRLTSYNGQAISYDVNGNVTKIGSNTFTWSKGKQLSTAKVNNITYTYLYNGDVNRTLKISDNGFRHDYVLDGNKILFETIIGPLSSFNHELKYIYAGNEIIGFVCDNNGYLFTKNAQRDIIGIVNESGNIVAKYVYDAWGKHIVCNPDGTENTSATFIGNINPFRYRGYYYDAETQLFYCNSRYYSPELCRWISPDSIEYLDPSSINGLNLYCYCHNNPIMYYDPSGHIAFFVVTAIIGAVVGFGLAAYNDYSEDGVWFNGSVGSYIGYTLGGAAIGAVAGLGASSLLAGNFLASCGQVYAGLQGLAWAYTMGGPAAAGLYMANNFFNSIHVNASWLGYWPSNNGFSGPTQSVTLQQGTVIQRIGGTGGTFVSPYYTDPMSLSLPYHQMSNMANPTMYVVNQPITVTAGQAAPWFGQYGGGTQYLLPQTIQELINSGILSRF